MLVHRDQFVSLCLDVVIIYSLKTAHKAEHLTVESYAVFICQQSLFHSRLKTFLFCISFPSQPFLFLLQDSLHGFPRLFTVISENICFSTFSLLFLHFLVVGSVR